MCFIGKKYSIFYYCRRNQQLKLMFHEYKCGQLMMSCFVLFNETPTGLIHALCFLLICNLYEVLKLNVLEKENLPSQTKLVGNFTSCKIKSRPKKCMVCRKTRPKKCVVFSKSRPKKCMKKRKSRPKKCIFAHWL